MNRGRGARLPSAHTVPPFTPGRDIVYPIGENRGKGGAGGGLEKWMREGDKDGPFIKKQSALI
jgi:hypothetical protein